jgi:hypothetical protein
MLEEKYTGTFISTWSEFQKMRKITLGKFNIEYLYYSFYFNLEVFHRSILAEDGLVFLPSRRVKFVLGRSRPRSVAPFLWEIFHGRYGKNPLRRGLTPCS